MLFKQCPGPSFLLMLPNLMLPARQELQRAIYSPHFEVGRELPAVRSVVS